MTVIAARYEVGELLGRGGMAEVFAGTDRRLGRQVAIKLVRPEIAAQPDLRRRFEAEARAAASLSHPNAVAVFDTGEEDGVAYIVMERLPGETLADRMAAGPLDPVWVRAMAVDVLGALGAAHAAGLIHRDVKPGNILVGADGRAKVSDFGIAKSVEAEPGAADLTGTGQLLGTPAYLAPERLDGAPASAKSDLYALGVVLYEALGGTKPFDGPTPWATAQAISSGTHLPLASLRSGLDPALAATVERAMALDPAVRFSSAAEMGAALGGAAPASPVAPTVDLRSGDTMVLGDPEPLPPVAAAPRADRRRLSIAGAVVAGLGALLAVILFAGAGSDERPGGSPQVNAATTAAPLSPAQRLAQALRSRAASLSSADGAMAAQVAQRLRAVADGVEAGSGGGPATALITVVPVWNRSGLLSDAAATSVIDLLKQVPGVDLTAFNAVATTSAPVTVERDPPDDDDKDKGDKGKGDGTD